jgi:hypothetical protein
MDGVSHAERGEFFEESRLVVFDMGLDDLRGLPETSVLQVVHDARDAW